MLVQPLLLGMRLFDFEDVTLCGTPIDASRDRLLVFQYISSVCVWDNKLASDVGDPTRTNSYLRHACIGLCACPLMLLFTVSVAIVVHYTSEYLFVSPV